MAFLKQVSLLWLIPLRIYLGSFDDHRNIVLKKADKGSCAVVWDCNDYIAEAEKIT